MNEDGWLDIPKIMEHFIVEHNRIHKDNDERFLEDEGRERFITYVSAVINGTGTYSVEDRTRDHGGVAAVNSCDVMFLEKVLDK